MAFPGGTATIKSNEAYRDRACTTQSRQPFRMAAAGRCCRLGRQIERIERCARPWGGRGYLAGGQGQGKPRAPRWRGKGDRLMRDGHRRSSVAKGYYVLATIMFAVLFIPVMSERAAAIT